MPRSPKGIQTWSERVFIVATTSHRHLQPGSHFPGAGTIGLLSKREAKFTEATTNQLIMAGGLGGWTETIADSTARDMFKINPDRFSSKSTFRAGFPWAPAASQRLTNETLLNGANPKHSIIFYIPRRCGWASNAESSEQMPKDDGEPVKG